MIENQASLTALMCAYHSMHSSPKIFDDFLAYHLIPDKRIQQNKNATTYSDRSTTVAPLMQIMGLPNWLDSVAGLNLSFVT